MSEPAPAQKLPFLLQAAGVISAELDTDKVLQRLMQLTHEHFLPDAVSVASVEEDGKLVFRAASGKSANDIIGMVVEPGVGIAGWVARHGEKVWVPDVHRDPRFYPDPDKSSGFKTAAILAVPVQLGDQTLAVLEMINPAPETNLGEAIDVMTALASLAAPAIQNARLFEQVRRAEARYQSLFELNLDPIVIIDTKGRLLDVNQAAQRLLGIAVAQRDTVVLPVLGLTESEFDTHKEKALRGEVPVWELRLSAPEERVLEVSLSYLPHYPASGAFQWIGHDITDRAALEEMRQQLSNMIVHDLRAPLGSILNSLELTLTAWRQKDVSLPIEQVLQIGLRSAHRMDHLIGNILDTARLQAQEKTISVSPIDIQALVADAVDMVAVTASSLGHTLQVDVQSDIPRMCGDHDLLRRVLINLLTNAVKYTPHGGHIHLRVSVDAQEFLFCVQDNGPGIAPEDQQHVFELFFRGRSQRIRGVGIGLAFCKLAVNAHGGRIWLESELDRGSTFCFTIPRLLDDQGALASEATA